MTFTGTSDSGIMLFKSGMRHARLAHEYKLPGLFTAIVVMAFVNATTLAPALHDPGPMHDASKCSICVAQTCPASGSYAPQPLPEQAAAPERVRVQAVAQPRPGIATPIAARAPPLV